jgi:hypothetical protein
LLLLIYKLFIAFTCLHLYIRKRSFIALIPKYILFYLLTWTKGIVINFRPKFQVRYVHQLPSKSPGEVCLSFFVQKSRWCTFIYFRPKVQVMYVHQYPSKSPGDVRSSISVQKSRWGTFINIPQKVQVRYIHQFPSKSPGEVYSSISVKSPGDVCSSISVKSPDEVCSLISVHHIIIVICVPQFFTF